MQKEVCHEGVYIIQSTKLSRQGYVVPGFIDVHAHWNGMGEQYPARSWELETFLAYVVTTLHKYVFLQPLIHNS